MLVTTIHIIKVFVKPWIQIARGRIGQIAEILWRRDGTASVVLHS
jgi:hypothetical protein